MTINSSEIKTVLALGGFLIIGVIGKKAGWFKIISGTNALLREQNQELRNQNAFLKGQLESLDKQHEQDKKEWGIRHQESLTEISKLQGRVETLTAVPLRNIDKALDALVKVSTDNAQSNKLILDELRTKAQIDAEDRDVLTNQSKHIHDEVGKILDKE